MPGADVAQAGPFVEVDWLAPRRTASDVRVIDFRWSMDPTRSGIEEYRAGHIPGAVFVELEDVTGSDSGAGRHPLPSKEQFERVMRAAGVSAASLVVVYDDSGGQSAPRLWWLLRYFGHARVAVLDGGLQAWKGPLERGDRAVPAGDFTAGDGRDDMVIDHAELRSEMSDLVMLDARARPRYLGDDASIDPVPGHIPGAGNAPWQSQVDDRGFALAPSQLRRRFEALGMRDPARTVAYCGSGVTACAVLVALERAGLPGARLYPGSWSDWCVRPGAPIASGPEATAADRQRARG